MTIRRITPAEAKTLVDGEGYVYLDVRSVPEFDGGHPEGAYNVPFANATPSGMQPNARFVEVVAKHFAKDAKLVVGCQAGGRSAKAAALLEQAGFTAIADQLAGFGGGGGSPGWKAAGLPVATKAIAGRSYVELE